MAMAVGVGIEACKTIIYWLSKNKNQQQDRKKFLQPLNLLFFWGSTHKMKFPKIKRTQKCQMVENQSNFYEVKRKIFDFNPFFV